MNRIKEFEEKLKYIKKLEHDNKQYFALKCIKEKSEFFEKHKSVYVQRFILVEYKNKKYYMNLSLKDVRLFRTPCGNEQMAPYEKINEAIIFKGSFKNILKELIIFNEYIKEIPSSEAFEILKKYIHEIDLKILDFKPLKEIFERSEGSEILSLKDKIEYIHSLKKKKDQEFILIEYNGLKSFIRKKSTPTCNVTFVPYLIEKSVENSLYLNLSLYFHFFIMNSYSETIDKIKVFNYNIKTFTKKECLEFLKHKMEIEKELTAKNIKIN